MNVIKYIFTRSLPKTGQSTVYTAGDDGTYQVGWWKNKTVANNKVRFIDNGDGTITDRATGLMWEKVPSTTPRTLLDWIEYANALTLAGYTNWRVPNINELLSLINYASYYNAVYSPFFDNLTYDYYFSSTRAAYESNYLKGVEFYAGSITDLYKGEIYYAICVRTI